MSDFMTINHIDDLDLQKYVDQGIVSVGQREHVINGKNVGYQFVTYNIFPHEHACDPALKECRGIKFDMEGNIIARPFHKFFNVGEVKESSPEAIDLNGFHIVTPKLDGSMVHSAIVDDELVFMTKRGITDIANKARDYALNGDHRYQYERACRLAHEQGYTPIFEYTSPDNRIVIDYDKPALTLIGCRHMVSGEYAFLNITHSKLVPTVAMYMNGFKSLSMLEAAQGISQQKGIEGFVIHFIDNAGNHQIVKIKTLEYVDLHRIKGYVFGKEDNVKLMIQCVLDGNMDDVLPLLNENSKNRVKSLIKQVRKGVFSIKRRCKKLVNCGPENQKEFATKWLKNEDKFIRYMCFGIRSGKYECEFEDIASQLTKFINNGGDISAPFGFKITY